MLNKFWTFESNARTNHKVLGLPADVQILNTNEENEEKMSRQQQRQRIEEEEDSLAFRLGKCHSKGGVQANPWLACQQSNVPYGDWVTVMDYYRGYQQGKRKAAAAGNDSLPADPADSTTPRRVVRIFLGGGWLP